MDATRSDSRIETGQSFGQVLSDWVSSEEPSNRMRVEVAGQVEYPDPKVEERTVSGGPQRIPQVVMELRCRILAFTTIRCSADNKTDDGLHQESGRLLLDTERGKKVGNLDIWPAIPRWA